MAEINPPKTDKTKDGSVKKFTLPDVISKGSRNNTIFYYGGTLKNKGCV